MHDVVVLVPTRHEASNVTAVAQRVETTLAATGLSWRLVFVDDSDDETVAVLAGLAAVSCHISVLHRPPAERAGGLAGALLAGLEVAESRWVAVMDADLQHPPELLVDMVKHYRAGAHQVVAQRDRAGDPWFRRVASRTFYRIVNALVDVKLVDGAGDFRLLSRRACDALLELSEYNRFSKGLFSWIGFNPVYLPYANVARATGRTRWTLRGLARYAVDGVMSFNDRPLRLAVYIGLPITLFAFGYMIWVIVQAIIHGVSTPGYVTVVTAVIAFGGLQMLLLGIMGEYLGRVYYETKRRPHYLVGETDEDEPNTPPPDFGRP